MEKASPVEKIKDWVFPGMVTLLSFFLWNTITDIKDDIAEVKADIKTLMVQNASDHIRIDGLERQVYKKLATSNTPIKEEEPAILTRYAILPKNELSDIKW